jgi:hypothetical protein
MLLQEPLWFLVALVVFVVLAVALIAVLWRFLRRVFRRACDRRIPNCPRRDGCKDRFLNSDKKLETTCSTRS